MKAKTLLTAVIGAFLGLGLAIGGTAFAQHDRYNSGHGMGTGSMGHGNTRVATDHHAGGGHGNQGHYRDHHAAGGGHGHDDTDHHAVTPKTKKKGKTKR